MQPIKARMEQLGLDFAALNRRYCDIRQNKGDAKATPNNRRGMLVRLLNEESEPTLQTFQDLIEALDGELVIKWIQTEEIPLTKFSKPDETSVGDGDND